jgi:type I restriction enzyme R subunit
MAVHREIKFEQGVEDHLLAHGWITGQPADLDVSVGVDATQLFAFIDATQPKPWARLVTTRGGDHESARAKFIDRLSSELDHRGTFDVLRHGIEDLGVKIVLAFFRPAHGLTPEIELLYRANRVTVTRQAHFMPGSNQTVDMLLAINGLPVATAELKNQLTGQNIEHARKQYREDRNPLSPILSRRAVVHFAVDQDEVSLTTRLAGPATRFIPFNRGDGGGKGNAINPGGYRTAYLWEQVWERNAWLDIWGRFVQYEPVPPGDKPAQRNVIFPRFHQWDAVGRLMSDTVANGVGKSYLIQHSAGSGKSNTIAWSAHRLASLHDTRDEKLFGKVIVISDRNAIDTQLQDTIYQFDHTIGLVEKIEHDSEQLAAALASEKVQVVITTLQKFPYVLDKVADLPPRNYAVVIDEAHSSQTGESAKALKAALGVGSDSALATAETEDRASERENDPDELVIRSVSERGRQPNISYYAFTATPKARTIELFGTPGPDGKLGAFHLYSMRQAIEEGFIIDVLTNYATYKTYYRLAKTADENDPELDRAKAAASIIRYVTLHPETLDQKAAVIVEHFRARTEARVAGHAKAMVVTASRLHAVRQKQAIDRYIAEKGYELHALVAFSGTVEDGGLPYTERQMNGLSEGQLPKQFARVGKDPADPTRPEYRLLVVAEKYQTGYDEPRLHTMFVDKHLDGLKAVQTLSRLNRTHPEKSETFILDFANDADDIQAAFKPYYETTITEPTDPNILYAARDRILDFQILDGGEVDAFVAALLAGGTGANARLYALTDPSRDRFLKLQSDPQEECRRAMEAYTRVYSFLAQIAPYADPSLEKTYLFVRALVARVPRAKEGTVDLGNDVVLTHLRGQLRDMRNLSLSTGKPELPGFSGGGRGKQNERVKAKLSQIIQVLNDRFGLELGAADALYFDQLREEMALDEELTAKAMDNTLDNFRLGFDEAFLEKVIARQSANADIYARIFEDDDFKAAVVSLMAADLYRRIHGRATSH